MVAVRVIRLGIDRRTQNGSVANLANGRGVARQGVALTST